MRTVLMVAVRFRHWQGFIHWIDLDHFATIVNKSYSRSDKGRIRKRRKKGSQVSDRVLSHQVAHQAVHEGALSFDKFYHWEHFEMRMDERSIERRRCLSISL